MNGPAEISMLLYVALFPLEQERVKSLESAIANALADAEITDRCFWTASNQENRRMIELVANCNGKETVIMDILSDEFSTISDQDLLSRLRRCLTDPIRRGR